MPSIIHQYIRDASFEIASYNFLTSNNKQAILDLNLNLSAKPVEKYFEVSIKIIINSKISDNLLLFIVDVEQCALINVENLKNEPLKTLLFIDVPHMIFPQLRQTINNLVQEGGFSSVWLQPPNFLELYQKNKFTFVDR